MSVRVSMLDIARKAGVSRSTVSFVLNGREDISIGDGTRERVCEAARALGYRANLMARALVSGRTRLIGLWTYGLDTAYCSRGLWLFKQELAASEYDLHIVQTDPEPKKDGLDARGDGWPVDGIVLRDVPAYAPRLLARACGAPIPLVSMGLGFTTEVDHVGIAIHGAAVAAVEHLIALGRKRVAYVAPKAWSRPTNPRRKAYMETIRRFGLKPEVILTDYADYVEMRQRARERIRDHVAARGCPGALFCYNDETAIGVQRGLFDLGLRVPEDAAIVGCDGIDETEFHKPALSTIALPQEEMCRLAWQFLRRRIEEPEAPRQAAILEPRLVVRESSVCRQIEGEKKMTP